LRASTDALLIYFCASLAKTPRLNRNGYAEIKIQFPESKDAARCFPEIFLIISKHLVAKHVQKSNKIARLALFYFVEPENSLGFDNNYGRPNQERFTQEFTRMKAS
jgi:hypothetical protein